MDIFVVGVSCRIIASIAIDSIIFSFSFFMLPHIDFVLVPFEVDFTLWEKPLNKHLVAKNMLRLKRFIHWCNNPHKLVSFIISSTTSSTWGEVWLHYHKHEQKLSDLLNYHRCVLSLEALGSLSIFCECSKDFFNIIRMKFVKVFGKHVGFLVHGNILYFVLCMWCFIFNHLHYNIFFLCISLERFMNNLL